MTSNIWYDPDYYGMSQGERKILLEFFFEIVQKIILDEFQSISSKGTKLTRKNIDFLGKNEIDRFTELGLEKGHYILNNHIIPHSEKNTYVGDYSETENKKHLQMKLLEFLNILRIDLHKYAPKQLSVDEFWTEKLNKTCSRFWESK